MAAEQVVINMKIIFKKKNATTVDKEFNIDEGSVYIENYNETLDSATIRISHITEQLNIEPFDKVILRDEEGRIVDKYMCVDTYTETMESLDPYIYSYEISLFSETKELEGISLPNLSITKLADGSHRSVYFYLTQYLDLFGEKIRKGTINSYSFYSLYRFSDEVESKFDSIDCPEMQWNAPTLREVLTDLMMVADCIPIVRNNVIGFINLTEKKSNISSNSHINYIQRSQSSEDYVSELKMNMVNVMQTTVTNVDNSTDVVEYLLFKANGNNNIVTDDSVVLKTMYPINRIKSIKMYRQLSAQYEHGDTTEYTKAMYSCDLTNINGYRFILEKQEYDCLDVDLYASFDENTPVGDLAKYQNYCVYYQRGSNVIDGWTKLTKNWPSEIFGSKTAFYHLMDILCVIKLWTLESEEDPYFDHSGYDLVRYHAGSSYGNSYYTTFFKIEYETTVETTFQASKDIAPTHKRVIIDNQTNSYVDAYNQGFMEYQKVNRLGNQQLYINARYENDYANIIKIGDYYNDSIVYQTQYQIYKNHIEVNAIATKDYILRDYFTGVKARVRSWKIATDSEALRRNVLDKLYVEFSKKEKTESLTLSDNVANSLISPLKIVTVSPLKYCAVYFTTLNLSRLPSNNNDYYIMELCSRIIGNSLLFYISGEDNFALGKRVSSEVDSTKILNSESSGSGFHPFRISAAAWSDNYGGIKLEPIRYVDDNGEFYSMSYRLLSGIDTYFEEDTWDNTDEKDFMAAASKRPVATSSEISNYYEYGKILTLKKDNKEIISLSSQLEFCSDTHDIVFTKKFLELQKWIRTATFDLTKINVFVGSVNDYNYKNPTLINTEQIVATVYAYTTSNTKAVVEIITTRTISENEVVYICLNSDILLCMVGTKKIYMNILRSRDYNIYNTDNEVIGEI